MGPSVTRWEVRNPRAQPIKEAVPSRAMPCRRPDITSHCGWGETVCKPLNPTHESQAFHLSADLGDLRMAPGRGLVPAVILGKALQVVREVPEGLGVFEAGGMDLQGPGEFRQ